MQRWRSMDSFLLVVLVRLLPPPSSVALLESVPDDDRLPGLGDHVRPLLRLSVARTVLG